jgi:hypothetical protein
LSARRDVQAAQKALDGKLINIRQFTERAIQIDQSLLNARLATLKEEEEAAVRSAKSQADATAKRAEIQLKVDTAILDSQLKQEELRRQQREIELRAEEDHQRRLQEIREVNRKAEEDSIRTALSRGTLAAAAGEKQLIQIERQRFEERKAQLQEEFVLAGANLQERQRVNDELAKLAAERAVFETDALDRINVAEAESVKKLRTFLQERQRILQENASLRVELLKQEADTVAAAASQFGATPETRRAAIEAQSRAELAAAELRHQLNLQRIEDDRQATVEAAGKNNQLVEEAERQSHDRRLLEEQRFQNERKAIQQQGAQEQAATDPSSNASLFGIQDEELSKFDAFGKAAAGALAQVSAQAGNFKTILTGAFSAVGAGLQSTLQAFILTGTAGPAAFKKLVAGVIAAIASESLVKAVFETAEGFAALAANRPDAAAKHFLAAKIYGAVGGVAAGIGLGIGAAGGLGGQGGGGAGGTGGGSASASAFQEQRDLRVTRGGEGQQGETVFEGNPMFAAITDLRNTVKDLGNRISSMPPEDVLTVGAARRPDVISSTTQNELQRNHDFTRAFGAALGVQ